MGFFAGLAGSVAVAVPNRLTLSVSFLDGAGVEVPVFEEDTRETEVTQPAAISDDTVFYLADETEVSVSVKLQNGTEVATPEGLPFFTEVRGNSAVRIAPSLSVVQALLESNVYASPDGTRWALEVADDGTVSASEITPD